MRITFPAVSEGEFAEVFLVRRTMANTCCTQVLCRKHDFYVLLLHVAIRMGSLPDLPVSHGHGLLHWIPRLLRSSRLRPVRSRFSRSFVFLQHRSVFDDVRLYRQYHLRFAC